MVFKMMNGERSVVVAAHMGEIACHFQIMKQDWEIQRGFP